MVSLRPRAGLGVRAAVWLVMAGGAGCAGRIVDVRPFTAHPDQQMDGSNVIVSWQNDVRTVVRYMRESEMDDAFRLPGVERTTGNPFLRRPPGALARFIVFRLTVRNESEYDVFADPARMSLRDETGTTLQPVTAQELTDYWMGRVTVALGTPVTWGPQLEALRKRDAKEKSVVETIFTGGLVPPRGEHTGYVAFRDERHTLRRADPERTKDLVGWMSVAGIALITADVVRPNVILKRWNEGDKPFPRAGRMLLAVEGGTVVWFAHNLWRWLAPPRGKEHRLQLSFEIVTRASRYGNPLRVAPMEFNFSKVRVPWPPVHDEEYEQWRP